MVEPGKAWKYVANAASQGAVDCSGAFTYWYRQAGSYMYHGSNTMWRKYTTEKGKIGEVNLIPGMAVFKMRRDGAEPSSFKNDGQGNFYHVGLYIGDGKVVEAKGTKYGCVTSCISDWGYAAKLKYTEYDVNASDETPSTDDAPSEETRGMVKGGTLNMRGRADKGSARITTIPNGATITIIGENGAWYKARYKNYTGYVMKEYVNLMLYLYKISGETDDKEAAEKISGYAKELGISLNVTGG